MRSPSGCLLQASYGLSCLRSSLYVKVLFRGRGAKRSAARTRRSS